MPQIRYFNGYWKVEDVIKNPNCLFVYGDNDVHQGKGGQAIIRGLPNTLGIPTKKYPSYHPSSYYTDNELELNKQKIRIAIKKLMIESQKYDYIIFSKDGLGTGLSDLPKRAPLTYKFLVDEINNFIK